MLISGIPAPDPARTRSVRETTAKATRDAAEHQQRSSAAHSKTSIPSDETQIHPDPPPIIQLALCSTEMLNRSPASTHAINTLIEGKATAFVLAQSIDCSPLAHRLCVACVVVRPTGLYANARNRFRTGSGSIPRASVRSSALLPTELGFPSGS